MKWRTVLIWGVAWGVFEATAGFVLHQLPIPIGPYIWFPAAYFMMDRVYQRTGQKRGVLWAALLAASIKLLNLFWAVRPDIVINPAIAIVLEALAMVGVLSFSPKRNPALVNALWRLGYMLYAATLMPVWIREVSVIRDVGAILLFMGREYVLSTLICFAFTIHLSRRRGVMHSERG
ncbi:MAG: hypothetical protein FWD25_12515 [Clostridia bacterium]|nr:hypothetical protein [Clostridia bacterium]